MDAGPFGMLDRPPSLVDVVGVGPGQRGNDGPFDLLGDVGYRLEVAGRTGGEPGLDYVYLHFLKLAGDLHLLRAGHADPGRLFAVAEGGV